MREKGLEIKKERRSDAKKNEDARAAQRPRRVRMKPCWRLIDGERQEESGGGGTESRDSAQPPTGTRRVVDCSHWGRKKKKGRVISERSLVLSAALEI